MTQQPPWDPTHRQQPRNLYGEARAPYEPQQLPGETMVEVKRRLRRSLMINGAFVVVPMVIYVVSGVLPWLILAAGVIGCVMAISRYARSRAAIAGSGRPGDDVTQWPHAHR